MIIATFILTGLAIVSPIISATIIPIFGIIYFALGFFSRKKLDLNSKRVSIAASIQLKTIQESLGSIKDIILSSSQPIFLKTYSSIDRPMRIYQAQNTFLGTYPRYIIEASALVLFAILGYSLTSISSNNAITISTLGLLALSSQKILSASQQIYSNWCAVNAHTNQLFKVVSVIEQSTSTFKIKEMRTPLSNAKSLALINCIRFQDVSFSFNSSSKPIIKNLSFEISSGEKVAFIGSTGSGKSTTINLLMGCCSPLVERYWSIIVRFPTKKTMRSINNG